jgi:predicted secreted protein
MASCARTGTSAMQFSGTTVAIVACLATATPGCASGNGSERQTTTAAPAPSVIVAAPAAAPSEADAWDRAPAQDVTAGKLVVKKGVAFAIELPANRTTPLEWVYDASAAPNVALRKQSYKTPPSGSCPDCTGTGGIERFAFEAVASGSAKLQFRYVSVVDRSAEPAEVLDVTVMVSD